LEPNHTEFIFVDDGTERKFGREIVFRGRLEQAISGNYFGPRPDGNLPRQYSTFSETQPLCPEESGSYEILSSF
jgi:hypothetical protein